MTLLMAFLGQATDHIIPFNFLSSFSLIIKSFYASPLTFQCLEHLFLHASPSTSSISTLFSYTDFTSIMFSFSSVPLFILLSAAATTYTSGEAPDIRLPGNAEVLRYIEESRLMGIAELERLDELESLVLKRMDLQDEEESEREKEAMHRFRRLQEDATAVEEKAEVGGMTIGKNRIRNQQEGYYSDGIFNRGNNRYRGDNYGRNYGNNNWYYPESEWNDNRDGWNRRRVCCQQCNRGKFKALKYVPSTTFQSLHCIQLNCKLIQVISNVYLIVIVFVKRAKLVIKPEKEPTPHSAP